MTYPKQLFKKGGPFGNPGRTYSVAGAADRAEEADLRAKGWADNVAEAYGKKAPAPTPKPAAIDETSAPTRAELEAKAEELGIGFNKRTKDETLAERIAEALS